LIFGCFNRLAAKGAPKRGKAACEGGSHRIVPTPSAVKDKVFILPQRLEDISRQVNHSRDSNSSNYTILFVISQQKQG
jgi:hypothetical protein